jgi:uncharacterized RDD family membrane protein YckC
MEPLDQIFDRPVSAQKQMRYAGFWIRVGAYLIDYVLLVILQIFMTIILGGSLSLSESLLVTFTIGVIYSAAFESSERQATPGKMAAGIKVGNANGDKISFVNAAGRYFGKIISTLLLCIGFMMVGWDSKKQGIHDMLAHTYVFYV